MCVGPGVGPAACRRGKHYQPVSTDRLLCELQLSEEHMQERHSRPAALPVGVVLEDKIRRRREEKEEAAKRASACVMHGDRTRP